MRAATPLPFSATVPRLVAPFQKVTLPVGVAPAPVTVAVNVTFWPHTVVAKDWINTIPAGAILFTLCSVLPAEVLKCVSPPYSALMLWTPPDKAVVV